MKHTDSFKCLIFHAILVYEKGVSSFGCFRGWGKWGAGHETRYLAHGRQAFLPELHLTPHSVAVSYYVCSLYFLDGTT